MSCVPFKLFRSFPSRLLDRSSPPKTLKPTAALLARIFRSGLLPVNFSSFVPAAAAGDNLSSLLLSSGNVAEWNALISTLSRNGFPSLALQTFSLMHRLALPLDSYSLCSALAAASLASSDTNRGRQIHAFVCKSGDISSVFVSGALIDFYARKGELQDAQQVFDEIPYRNTVCLNALLSGYVHKRLFKEGVSLFLSMQSLIEPDGLTISTILKICAEEAVIRLGMECHAYVIRRLESMEKDAFLSSSLIEMYGKCGYAAKARLFFYTRNRRRGKGRSDIVLWTSLLNAHGRNGQFDEVISAFEGMLSEGTLPDEIIFLVVLSACARSGNVMKGIIFFELMVKFYSLSPWCEHYSCVIDMLCKAGELEKAWSFVNEIVMEDNDEGRLISVSAWGAILSACSDSGNVKIGQIAFQRARKLDPDNAGIYVELSNLYARAGMWDELDEIRQLIEERGMKKDVGFSRLEVGLARSNTG
ncbi:Pentatricopeptide repeat-containing protein [Apostasia shenzhenica]|uniref:Pentatricopeptide repeat-containing protein n=1 Tax=Apostasia shenzhenica TaxID=1088818 RepID=A0A2I0B9I6_9ASPA|nr:Pentatricopeptide repeat-containing protein [Apostasia shenzhenica]